MPRNVTDVLAPKPVHPSAVRNHGLFGMTFVRQHMIVDKRWKPNSLTEEFKGMGDLLVKRLNFKKLEFKAERKGFVNEHRNLRRQCRDGRAKLQLILYGDNTKSIRNFLINHKDMQRLYQKMPVYQVDDNINQRTFVLRKERDRLGYRLEQLKNNYEKQLLTRATVENRIKYENEFVLEEEIKSRDFRKKLAKSSVRLNAVKTITVTYKKMLQVLRHDSIFYEPILRSLTKDIEDQGNFIKHILYLGMPGIAKFAELSEEYKKLEDDAKTSLSNKLKTMQMYTASGPKRTSLNIKIPEGELSRVKRYVRETNSMVFLRNELAAIENIIKMVKYATLCSLSKEIFPRIKSQTENNAILNKKIEHDKLGHAAFERKLRRAEVLEGVLIHSISEEEIIRLDRIKELRESIKREDELEEKTLARIKNRGDLYVLFRFTLWNIYDYLRHVDHPFNRVHQGYPISYLRLPLLKFEMLTMRSYPPEMFEENVDEVMRVVKRKLASLMKATPAGGLTPAEVTKYSEEYVNEFLDKLEFDGIVPIDQVGDEEELLQQKTGQFVPNRKQIKTMSAKLVDEMARKDE